MAKSFYGKKIPSVLVGVTNSRDRSHESAKSQELRSSTNGNQVMRRSISTRLTTVDQMLQNVSEIPSGQSRLQPMLRKTTKKRGIGLLGLGARCQNVPGRSTRVVEKLVLIPDALPNGHDSEEEIVQSYLDYKEEEGPLNDVERDILKKRGGVRGKSYAERLPKAKRTEKLARVTAYCTAQGYKTKATAAFVKKAHGARTKLYDDCLYTVYHLPLLPGVEGIRIRSSPVLKNPGGKEVLDEEIERSEQRDYYEDYFDDDDKYLVGEVEKDVEEDKLCRDIARQDKNIIRNLAHSGKRDNSNRIASNASTFAEMFVFSYGVVVFWNFREKQEKDILADLTFSNHQKSNSLVSRPLEQDDYEKEEFHFEYSSYVKRSRVFNDMITLRSGDHMIKLTISHAIAQSTKLCLFEEQMNQTMANAQHIPKHLALTGQLGLSRCQIVKILGNLFKSRVDVNLSSNILDVPNFFWDSEPTLHPLYSAIRDYLEITPRIKVLNERCKVFLELAEILSDSIADTKMSTITWIIIALIIISICVTVMEVGLRSLIFARSRPNNDHKLFDGTKNWTNVQFTSQKLMDLCGSGALGMSFTGI
ncbi:Sad1-interacting factor 3 [Erysiphe necator]|nr:Sad1-interacting factor 3 [Erysiphe necator]